jgi:O-antigen/teichoic acid export membrane protein
VTDSGSERHHVAAAARVGAGTAITSVAWIAARALALVTLVLLTQSLPAEDLGALLAAIAAGLLGATLATGGLPDATVRSAASASSTQGAGFGRGDLWSALWRFAATLPLVFVLLLLISDGADGLNWGLWAAGALLAVTQGGTTILAAVFRARGQAARFALATGLAVAIGRTVVAALALALDVSAELVLWSFVVINAGVIAATWGAATRGLPPNRSDRHGAGPLQLGGAVWALLAHLDIVVVGVVIGADAAGVYGATLRLAEFSYQFVIAVSVLYLPEAVKLFAADRREALVALYRTSSRWSALVSLLLAGVGFILAPRFAELLLPDDASASTTVMRILFVGYAFYGALGLGYLTSVAAGSFRQIRRASLAALPAIVGGTVIAAELWGVTGAACATAAGYIGFNLWWLWTTRATLGATPFDRPYLRALLACALSVAGAAGMAASLFGAAPLVAIAVVGLGTTVLWMLLAVIVEGLTPQELRALKRVTWGLAGRPVRRPVAEE